MGVKDFFRKLGSFVNSFLSGSGEYRLDFYIKQLNCISAMAEDLSCLSDQELKARFNEARISVLSGKEDEEIVCSVFALVREACYRVIGLRPYDVQVLAALVLNSGKLAEMKTGEGKTLAAVMPAIYHALGGKGVHILTFNDYLAERDAKWMGPIYRFFDLSVAFSTEKMSTEERKSAYQCDIVYATAKTIGFDYLRSTLAWEQEEILLRPFNFALVDEADALLIDEARNPLVLAGDRHETGIDLFSVSNLVGGLSAKDYQTDMYGRDVFLSEQGIMRIEKQFGLDNLFADEHHELLSAINLALQAKVLLKKDVDYIIKGGQIKLVDEFTGRIMKDRKWQHGLQMAVEAMEGLQIQPEGSVLASIPLHHFMNLYPVLAGMTATAREAAYEFDVFYGLQTMVIPSNKPCIRNDFPDLIFADRNAKLNAVLEEVRAVHNTGRPILIGTLTVKESEELSYFLAENGLNAVVLNAHNDAEEAAIIANAGMQGAITISTNMAGRGTDIIPGGRNGEQHELVISLGGLHVIGTNRHESLRIDMQLRGRAGRQGDPGSSRFIISLEDDLMLRYRLKDMLPVQYRSLKHDRAIDDPVIISRIAQAQRIIEGQMFEMRRTLNDYSSLVEKHRLYLLQQRTEILEQGNVSYPPEIKKWILYTIDRLWADHLDHASELREGIHLLRLGGEDPLRNFFRRIDLHFRELNDKLEEETVLLEARIQNGEVFPAPEKPSSTWTYLVNDNPFKNKLAINMLAGAFFGTSR